MFKYLNRFTSVRARGLFDYDLNDRTRDNGAKLIVKHFNTLVAQHFYPIEIATTWNALPSDVVGSRTMNFFNNSLEKHWAEIPRMSKLTGDNATMQVCTNSRWKEFCWKWTQWSVLLLLHRHHGGISGGALACQAYTSCWRPGFESCVKRVSSHRKFKFKK